MPETSEPSETVEVTMTINREEYTRDVPARMLLIHFLRDELDFTGSKIGCETSACGCCTVLMDGDAVKSCTLLALQADGSELVTVEGLADDGELGTLQRAFSRNHAQQCGYCTAGMVMATTALLNDNPDPTRDEIKRGIAGNLCRCTGYRFIIDAVEEAAEARLGSADE